MSDLVIVAFGEKCLALTRDQFREALERGRELVEGSTATPSGAHGYAPEYLCTAEEMEKRTKVKAAWFLEQARRGELPHHKLGKYVRFRFEEVLAVSGEGEVRRGFTYKVKALLRSREAESSNPS